MKDFVTIKQELKDNPFNISIVGHTNHGKTSLARTLSERIDFGEVRNEATTTTEIEYKAVRDGGATVMTIYDTPGLEMADAAIESVGLKITIDQAVEFFDDQQHALELMVLKHIRDKTNLILYVINVTEPVEIPFPEEYLLMRRSGVPVIPILNFCFYDESYIDDWEDFFKKEGGQNFIRFDAHRNTIDDQILLFEKARAMHLDDLHKDFLYWWIKKLQNKRTDRNRNCSQDIAGMLLEVAAFAPQVKCQTKDKKAKRQALRDRFIDELSNREWEALQQIASEHGFTEDTLETEFRDFDDQENWRDSIWNNAKQEYGVVAASSTSGALVGGTIDAFVGGTSLGMGALIGAAVGAAAGVFGGKYVVIKQDDRLGKLSISVEPRTLGELLSRSLMVWELLENKGKAERSATKLTDRKHVQKGVSELVKSISLARNKFNSFAEMEIWQKSSAYRSQRDLLAQAILKIKNPED